MQVVVARWANRSSWLAVMASVFAICPSATGQSPVAHPIQLYYPLAKGNSWRYQVRETGQRVTSVEWRVTSERDTQDGPVYQVWPFPAQSDDEAMTLKFTKQALEEDSGTILLRLPAFAGDSWSTSRPKRTFRVLTAGKPCQTGTIRSEDCIVIEEDDDALSFRTVTTYAKGVGPIRYVYYSKHSTANIPIQTVNLMSFSLARR
jgi:hypothetical protein